MKVQIMKIYHKVSLVDEPKRRETLTSLGVRFGNSESPLVRMLWFDIDETDPAWSRLIQLIPEWNVEDGCDPGNLGFVHSEFSKDELAAASFLQIFAWQHGFPQPKDDFGYRGATYDLRDYCPNCGIGKKQIGPFRMISEPKWGRRHFLQLNWVVDELFVTPEIWSNVFDPIGVAFRPVIEHRSGKPLRTVVQIEIPRTMNELSLNGCRVETCQKCRREKYLPIAKGFFPSFAGDQAGSICKTQEFFGSGATGWNAILVSNALYKTVQSEVGLTFVPMEKTVKTDFVEVQQQC